MTVDPWPLRHLVITSPRLELRPDDDAGLFELVDVARRGVHAPGRMPFVDAWTDVPEDELGPTVLSQYWRDRARSTPQDWAVNFLVRAEGRVVGSQRMSATAFAVTGEITSSSWLGTDHQGRGFGGEMRAAMLLFAFDHLGAEQARSNAFPDNPASLRVSERFGYMPDGTVRRVRRGEIADARRMLLTAQRFAEHRPDFSIEVRSAQPCLPKLGAEDRADGS